MKKILYVMTILVFGAAFSFGQQEQAPDRTGSVPGPGQPVPEEIGTDTAQQKLKEVSLSKFEDAGFWQAYVSSDVGISSSKKLDGSPLAKKPIPDEQNIGIQEDDKYVLGIKTEFYHRGESSITISPSQPIHIAGVVKTISVWVAGRNYNHNLKAVFRDFTGNYVELTMGKLNFSGWKQLVVAIPPEIEQKDAHYSTLTGIRFLGFRIECDLAETFGSYFIYLDDLRAVTDLFAEENRDEDDMLDNW